MKKFALVAAILLLTTGFVFAADPADTPFLNQQPTTVSSVSDSVLLTAALQGYLTLSNLTTGATFLLNTTGESIDVATGKIATNLKNWKMVVTAVNATDKGTALVSTVGSFRVPYKFTLTGGSTIGTAFDEVEIISGGITKDYTNRVSGGSNGENITLNIKYGAEDTNNWFAGLTYTDTITVTLSAN